MLWIGTLGRGLLRISRGEIMSFSMADGLFDNTIQGIVADRDRHLWMSTDHGIFAISLDDIAAFERGEIEAHAASLRVLREAVQAAAIR